MAKNMKSGGGILEKVGGFFSGLLGSKKQPAAEARPGRGAPRNLANQHGMLPLEQETVMFSAYAARRQQGSQQTLLLCSVDEALAFELKSKLHYQVVVAETKQAMIDAVFSNSLDFIFLDFEPLKDGTLSFRLGKKVRATGYTGKIFLMGRSSKNDGGALAKSFGADGLVDKNFQQISDLLE